MRAALCGLLFLGGCTVSHTFEPQPAPDFSPCALAHAEAAMYEERILREVTLSEEDWAAYGEVMDYMAENCPSIVVPL